jgi:hypothetical protein
MSPRGRRRASVPVPELIELATRLVYWATATQPYKNGWHTEDRHIPPADVGDEVRRAVAAAFAELLPGPVRDALALDRRHVHEVRTDLGGQAARLLREMVEGPDGDEAALR